MSSTLVPFLYRTRTLQRASRVSLAFTSARSAHYPARGQKQDNSIPFEWDPENQNGAPDEVPGNQSTITPSEAQVFKGIFDEISQGKMPAVKKRSASSQAESSAQGASEVPFEGNSNGFAGRTYEQNRMARSIVEQARVTDFREKFLRRYPQSLRNAAQVALGLYELEPTDSSDTSQMLELDEADKSKWDERARYERARNEERDRVNALMKSCPTDASLWKLMEEEVFSLPGKLGILQTAEDAQGALEKQSTKKGKRKAAGAKSAKKQQSDSSAAIEGSTATRAKTEEEKRIMDVHGPLYSHFISTALTRFDTAFALPSPFVFRILPRVKELGLPSYVLGVSTAFYSKLAKIYWDRYGDANSALEILQEMNAAGLYADEESRDLLAKIRDHLHGCTWGAQGPFVMAMMESPPYDSALTQRLEEMERYMQYSLNEQAHGYTA